MHAWFYLLQLETFEAINNSLVGTLPESWSNLATYSVRAAVVNVHAIWQMSSLQSEQHVVQGKRPVWQLAEH